MPHSPPPKKDVDPGLEDTAVLVAKLSKDQLVPDGPKAKKKVPLADRHRVAKSQPTRVHRRAGARFYMRVSASKLRHCVIQCLDQKGRLLEEDQEWIYVKGFNESTAIMAALRRYEMY